MCLFRCIYLSACLLLVTSSFGSGQQNIFSTISWWKSCRNKLFEYWESYNDSNNPIYFWGMHNVSDTVDKEVRAMLRKVHLHDAETIQIKKFSLLTKKIVGEKNAFVCDRPGCQCFLYIAEEWFITLPQDIKEFLITREAMKLKCNQLMKHKYKALTNLASFSLLGLLIPLLYRKYFPNNDPLSADLIGFNIFWINLGLNVDTLLSDPITREDIFEADREAALFLKNIEGGLKLLAIYQEEEDKMAVDYPNNRWRAFLINNSLPSFAERKQALKDLGLGYF